MADPKPELILTKGRVLTMAPKQPEAQAVAIQKGRILAVGANQDIVALKGPRTKVLDLRGKTVVPGFIDAHNHFTRHGIDLGRLDLGESKSLKSLLEGARRQAKALPEGSWIIGFNWDESRWPEPKRPTRQDLDNVAPKHSVYLRRVDGHLCVVNSLAMGSLSIPLQGPGVEIDATGKRSGILTEQAAEAAAESLPLDPAQALAGTAQAAKEAFQLGITSLHQTTDALDIQLLRVAQRKGTTLPRVYLKVLPPLLEPAEKLGILAGLGDENVRYGGVKVYTDGSLGARTAALSGTYADAPEARGDLLHAPEALADLVAEVHGAGFQVALHCIGDRAIQACLDAIEAAVKRAPRKDHRHRLEHFEGATEEQMQRAMRLGVVASCQPNFIGEWGQKGQMYEARLGKERAATLNRFRLMADIGLKLAFGSDNMPTGPLYGLHWAVNAPHKEQRLEVEEALRAYTLDAAYASFEEHLKGSIEPGKLADLVVLNGDPRQKPKDIAKLRVDTTILGGDVVYKRA